MSSVLNKVSPVGGNMSDSQLCVNYENYLFYSFPVIVLFPGVVLCPASWWFTLRMYRLILSQNVKVLCRFSEAFLCVSLIFFSTNFLAPNLASLYSNLCLLSQWVPWAVFGILILLHRLVISSMRQPGDNKDHVFLFSQELQFYALYFQCLNIIVSHIFIQFSGCLYYEDNNGCCYSHVARGRSSSSLPFPSFFFPSLPFSLSPFLFFKNSNPSF